jgi:hypothetical protein
MRWAKAASLQAIEIGLDSRFEPPQLVRLLRDFTHIRGAHLATIRQFHVFVFGGPVALI